MDSMSNLENEYRYNPDFREYVDKHCKRYNLTVEEALRQEIVKQVYLYYAEI